MRRTRPHEARSAIVTPRQRHAAAVIVAASLAAHPLIEVLFPHAEVVSFARADLRHRRRFAAACMSCSRLERPGVSACGLAVPARWLARRRRPPVHGRRSRQPRAARPADRRLAGRRAAHLSLHDRHISTRRRSV